MDKLEPQIAKLDAQLKQWAVKLDAFAAKAEEAGTAVKLDYRHGVDDLKVKYQVAQAKLDELKAAGDADWKTFKAGVESAWKDLEAAFKNLKS